MFYARHRRLLLASLAGGALIAAVVPALPARANDTSAQLAAGGLEFVQNNDVEMLSEDLFISAAEVRVRYVFRNRAKQDVTTLVAFPMPDITITEASNLAIPVEDDVNFLKFRTVINGKPVTADIQQRALAVGVDRSALLRDLKVPLAPQLPSTQAALDALPKDKWDELIKLGLARSEEYDVGTGMKAHLQSLWTLQTTYYWLQTFPAGAETIVEHSYMPSVGMSVGTIVGMPTHGDAFLDKEQKSYSERYCIEPSFAATAQAAWKKAGTDHIAFSDQRISYILKTGSNWAGPIARFKLTVDKGAPGNLVSFCGTNVKKVSPTRFEMTTTDFFPQQDLNIIILVPHAKK